uniref:Insulin-like growth factor n=1 Tax=Grapholita molesta TaxID=192188 RepID=A0A8F2Q175_GRAMO|nr:insulin-like growth factor [Grapholita molesta]
MLVKKAMQLVLVAWALQPAESATAASVKLCGRRLSEIMSRVCHVYNSPSWTDDNPTVVEQPGTRRKRQVGIADQCCTFGCTWEQLNEYCAISNSESTLSELAAHMTETGSTEHKRAVEEQRPQETPPEVQETINDRPDPVVGTVSPVLTWGRTLNTDLPPMERDRYNYIAVYS